MEVNDNKKYWSICNHCNGQGRVVREPSKKRRRRYQSQLDAFNRDKNTADRPISPESSIDICLDCIGSGLENSEIFTPINPHYPHVAIIGAGIGGVALAVACLHRGIPFTLYERDASFDARSQGYGLTLQQASKAIQGLGIFSLPDGIVSTRHVVHNSDGKIIGEWGLRKWKGENVKTNSKRKNIHIARQSLRLALLQQLPDDTSIKWGHKFIDFTVNKQGGTDLNFEVNGNIIQETANLMVGADGIRSSVRELLIIENKLALQYLGCIVILGICSLETLQSLDNPLLDSKTVFQTVNGYERIYMMPYDKDTIMWQLSFPLSEKESKELSKKGSKAMKEESLKRLGHWHNPIPQILEATHESNITGYPVYDRELLNSELLSSFGNVTLIGDAAHPMSPFKGQGANQAILDAMNLARKISTECGPDSNWRETGLREIILQNFEKEMIIRTSPKVKGSRLAIDLLHSDAVLYDGDQPRGRGIHSKTSEI